MRYRARAAVIACAAALVLDASDARGFTHVVQKGDTLASIAERYYGRIQHEKLLVAANALDAQGGTPIIPGMRLEVPALSHRRVKKGETWPGLATQLLGAPHRSDVISMANGSSPWLTPSDGQIIVPYNLPVIVGTGDTIITIAYKYMGDMNKAWVLDHYNGLKGKRLQPGDLVLVPLTDLPLTDDAKKTVLESNALLCSQATGETRAAQKKVATELPALGADIRGGRYVDALSRANRFLALGAGLTNEQIAVVHRYLLEAYAALDAPGLASASCGEWKKHDPKAKIDPILMSPKLVEACERSAQ